MGWIPTIFQTILPVEITFSKTGPYLTLFNDLAEESGKVKRITSKEMDVFHRLSIYVITVVNKTM